MNARIVLAALVLLAAFVPPPGAPGQVVLEPGAWVTGDLRHGEGGRVYDVYGFPPGFQGFFRLTVESADFDAMLGVVVLADDEYWLLVENDDFQGLASRTDSRTYGTVAAGEAPEIQVRSWSGTESGRYRIRLDTLRQVATEPQTIGYGADLRGVVAETDAFMDGVFQDRFHFRGAAGDVVRMILQSDDFQASLAVWEEGGRFIAEDEGLERGDVWLEVELPASGTYEIRVRPRPTPPVTPENMLGAYRLRMGPGLDPPRRRVPDGLAFTAEERADLRHDGKEVWHDALGFRFPAPAGRFTLLNAADEGPEELPQVAHTWGVRHGPSQEVLTVTASKGPEVMTAYDLKKMVKDWVVMVRLAGGTLEDFRLDWQESRSVTARVAHEWMPGGGMEMRCRTSGPDRIPSLLVCLDDGPAFSRSLAGLRVR